MEDGNIVYLCENLFFHFRIYFDWIISKDNPYCANVISKKIENKFKLILGLKDTNQAIVIFDNEFDTDLAKNVPGYKNDQFKSVIPCFFVPPKEEFIDIESIRRLISTPHFFNLKKFKRKCFIFKVPFDKLTKIEGL